MYILVVLVVNFHTYVPRIHNPAIQYNLAHGTEVVSAMLLPFLRN